jgi:hypothetical protein
MPLCINACQKYLKKECQRVFYLFIYFFRPIHKRVALALSNSTSAAAMLRGERRLAQWEKRVDIYSVLYSNTVHSVHIHVTLLALVQTASSRDDPLSYLTRFLLFLFFFFMLLYWGFVRRLYG